MIQQAEVWYVGKPQRPRGESIRFSTWLYKTSALYIISTLPNDLKPFKMTLDVPRRPGYLS